ncbi:bursicon-like [Pecten maximus]|uniref:bursicon-like n=1 Tax=Pecten maximus TaxID=6579 RepID=UPI0014586DEC|nr:bursicon-like [Pecten maximus]
MSDISNLKRTGQICIYLLLLTSAVSSECNRRRIIHTLSYEGCQPKPLLSFACDGACSSYSRPSVDLAGELTHYCECCKQTETRMLRTALICPNRDGRSIRRILIRVNIPIACACRPCSALPANIIPAEQELQNGKRSSFDILSKVNETKWTEDDADDHVIEESNMNKIDKGKL